MNLPNKTIKKAVLLVGGRGSRLYPLTHTRPKPLVLFCNIPIIQFQIEKLAEANVKTIILALNYFSEQIIESSKLWEKIYDLTIIYSQESIILGTAGPLKLAEKYIGSDDFIVMNTDIYCNLDLNAMVSQFYKCVDFGSNSEEWDISSKIKKSEEPPKIIAMLMTTMVDDPTRYGVLRTEGKTVLEFLEKPKRKKDIISNIINGGIYIFKNEVLKYIELKNMSIETEVFPLIASRGLMAHYLIDSIWFDIGVPSEYLNGQKKVLANDIDGLYKIISKINSSYLNSNGNVTVIPSRRTIEEKNSITKQIQRSKSDDSLLSNVFSSPFYCPVRSICIGRNVKIGRNVDLYNCTIFDNCVIEDNCVIRNSLIGFNCTIKEQSRIHSVENGSCSILGDFVIVEPNSEMIGIQIGPKSIWAGKALYNKND